MAGTEGNRIGLFRRGKRNPFVTNDAKFVVKCGALRTMSGLAFRFRADTQRTREHYRCPGRLPRCRPGPVADRATIAAGTGRGAGDLAGGTVRPGGGPRAR